MSNALDHDTYSVIYRNALGDVWANETHFPGDDRGDLITDILGGAYDTAEIFRVIRINIAAGVVADVTAEIAQAVSEYSLDHECEPCKEARDLCARVGFDVFDDTDRDSPSAIKWARIDHKIKIAAE